MSIPKVSRTGRTARASRFARPELSRPVLITGAALLAVDLLLLVGNLIFLTVDEPAEDTHPVFSNLAWNGDNDGSYIEIFGYLQVIGAAIALVALWRTTRTALYGVWALVFAVMVADDFFTLHELAGWRMVVALDLPPAPGLGPQDLGEALFWGVAAVVLGGLLLIAYLRAPRPARHDTWVLVGLMALLTFFALVVDITHVGLRPFVSSFVTTFLVLMETAGELVVMTLLFVAVLHMLERACADRTSN